MAELLIDERRRDLGGFEVGRLTDEVPPRRSSAAT